jgi:hypothetical protein
MLDRIGAEHARATSIVRYSPGSAFTAHTHGGGEEYLVLEGVFQDEQGDHGIGRYVRNPPGSHHTPRSAQGAVIFVKLQQFNPLDLCPIDADIAAVEQRPDPARPGVRTQLLHRNAWESVQVETWSPGVSVLDSLPHGGELLLLRGEAYVGSDLLRRWSWLRLPPGSALSARSSAFGATVWVKRHLAQLQVSADNFAPRNLE